MTIAEAKRRIDGCVAGFETKSYEVVDGMSPEMVEKQKEQMYAGENALGEPITPPYTPFTVTKKQEKGQPYDRVTLKDTGAFYERIFVSRHGKDLIFGSTDSKTDELTEKYGYWIFGLKTEAYASLSEEWKEKMLSWIKQMIFN